MESDPDVMVAVGYPGQATVYLREFFEAGYNQGTDLLFCDGTQSLEIPEALGAENLAGFMGTVAASVGGDSSSQFEADYEAVYGELPHLPYITNFYDAVVVAGLAAATCDAKGMEITPICIRDNLREVANPPGETVIAGVAGLKKALELIKEGKAINYEGAAGAVDFDQNGDVVTPIEIWKYIAEEPFIETVSIEMEIPEK
jgi:ABC-type branched-subunit amino acid transport system substrate-binding protein